MKIATFYSFKGGVGRSLAAVNMAWLLNSMGRSVVLIDGDLEAPGLSMMDDFTKCGSGRKKGIFNYIIDYFDPARKQKPSIKKYALPHFPGDDGARLAFIPVANLSKTMDLSSIPWKKLNQPKRLKTFIADFRQDLRKSFDPDWVIIDARTGFTEIGGLFTRNVPDIVVLFSGLNDQNLQGTKWVLQHLRENQAQVHMVVLTPMPEGEEELKKARIAMARELLDKETKNLPLVSIPYIPRAALKEEIFVRDWPDTMIAKAYQELKKAFIQLNDLDVETALAAARKFNDENEPDLAIAQMDKIWPRFSHVKSVIAERASELLFKGVLVGIQGKYEEALALFDLALKIKPDLHEALNNKGVALAMLGRHEDAILAYDQALKIKPDHEALNNKGVALAKLGRHQDAILAYDQALKIKPDKHEALYNKGLALAKLGRHEDAILAYDQALKIKPDKHEALNNKGVALDKLGRHEDAINAFDQALKIKPDLHEALYNKACAFSLMKRKTEALKYLRRAVKLHPEQALKAATDEDFEALRGDPAFLKIINP